MRIEILGTGCYKCISLESLVADVLRQLGKADVKVIRISDERAIRKVMPLDEIPGLVIDGHLMATRGAPARQDLEAWLAEG